MAILGIAIVKGYAGRRPIVASACYSTLGLTQADDVEVSTEPVDLSSEHARRHSPGIRVNDRNAMVKQNLNRLAVFGRAQRSSLPPRSKRGHVVRSQRELF
jgi:hypothetical protein